MQIIVLLCCRVTWIVVVTVGTMEVEVGVTMVLAWPASGDSTAVGISILAEALVWRSGTEVWRAREPWLQ